MKSRFAIFAPLLLFGCGGLDGSGTGGGGGSVSIVIQNPDESASGTAKALPASEFSQSKAVSTASYSQCTLTATGPNSASTTVSVPSGASQIEVSLNVPIGSNYTICAECVDDSKTANGVTVGIRGCTNNVTISGSDQIAIGALFLNLASRSSGDVRYCRVRQDNTTQMKIICGFNGTLTSAQKTTTQCNLEIDSSLKDGSPETINAGRSNGFVSGSKGNPYFIIGPGLASPACTQYNTGGSKVLRCTGAWGTDSDGNTTMTATLGVKQGEGIATGRNARFAAACTKDGSNWVAIPSSGMAEFNTSKGGNEDTTSLATLNASCSSNGACGSGFCAGDSVCGSAEATTLAGTVTNLGGSGFSNLTGTCLSPDGNTLYAVDSGNHVIYKFDLTLPSSNAGYFTTFAGEAGSADSTNGACTSARFQNPYDCAVNSANDTIYISDGTNNLIRAITIAGCQVSTFAGATGGGSLTNGTGTAARFNVPAGLAIDSSGTLYVSDADNRAIRKITSDGVVTTVAGNGTAGSTNGIGTSATFSNPWGIALDSTETYLYVAEEGNNDIRVVNLATQVVSTLVQSGVIADLTGVTVDPSGTYLYVAGAQTNKIKTVTISTGAVNDLASVGLVPYDVFLNPHGNTLYFVEYTGTKVQKIQ